MAEVVLVNDLNTGNTFQQNGNIYQVIGRDLNKTAMRQMVVKVKVKNLRTGVINEMTFTGGDKVEIAHIDRKEMQYLYNDGEVYYVMDVETFDQITLPMDENKDAFKFVRENTNVRVLSYNGSVFGVEPDNFVVLEVTETEPGLKGNTATNTLKPAKVETGAEVRVPLFIEQGELIEIDTRDGSYMGRAKSYDR